MFDYDITETKHFTSKADGEQAYRNWVEAVGLRLEDFPFNVKSTKMFKNKPIIFHVCSWGAYIGGNGEWIAFIAYRFNGMRHVVQYSWTKIVSGTVVGQPTKNEWIGG